MIIKNKTTGEDITSHVIALLERKIDHAEFQRLTGLTRDGQEDTKIFYKKMS